MWNLMWNLVYVDEIRCDLDNILETIDMRKSHVLSAYYVGKKYTTNST